ncbi:MAG: CDP-diacylglycerol--glycerol-3-phosphate 3-phosphatidyltransferase [Bacilli bacterium]|nr:CDP-diacylglycerol--glycerol-3-phosphate 3-phosphatidyltransferase [Bacilli bacterium]
MNLPTKITFSRIIATVLMLIFLFVMSLVKPEIHTIGDTPLTWVYLGLFIFFVLASYTDHLDGSIARKRNMVTDLGKFLDPIADKLLINSLIIFLAIPGTIYSGQIAFPYWCAIILIIRDLIIDALRQMAAIKGTVIPANIWGKLKTVLEMVCIGVILLNDFPFSYFDASWGAFRIAYIFVYLATVASVVSGAIYMYKGREVFLGKKIDGTK